MFLPLRIMQGLFPLTYPLLGGSKEAELRTEVVSRRFNTYFTSVHGIIGKRLWIISLEDFLKLEVVPAPESKRSSTRKMCILILTIKEGVHLPDQSWGPYIV